MHIDFTKARGEINPEGEPLFEPARNTPRDINNLLTSPALLDNNPNGQLPSDQLNKTVQTCHRQIERLSNLDALPAPFGFQVSCLPIKLAGAGAGWTRAVAVIGDPA